MVEVVLGNAQIKLCLCQRSAWDICEEAAFLPRAELRAIAVPEIACVKLC